MAIDFYRHNVDLFMRLTPPIEAFGVGGSRGTGQSDEFSDLDFFIYVPTTGFLKFIDDFPRLIVHPVPPIARQRIGFFPYFGFQYLYLYPNRMYVDYFINCRETLLTTPMAHNTRVINDVTGEFTEYHRNLPAPNESHDEHLTDVAGETLLELTRMRKYARRGDLILVVHRLERLRLIILALERYLHHGAHFAPHDADKRVARDLGIGMVQELAPTFPTLEPASIAKAVRATAELTVRRIRELDSHSELSSELWNLYTELTDEIVQVLTSHGQE